MVVFDTLRPTIEVFDRLRTTMVVIDTLGPTMVVSDTLWPTMVVSDSLGPTMGPSLSSLGGPAGAISPQSCPQSGLSGPGRWSYCLRTQPSLTSCLSATQPLICTQPLPHLLPLSTQPLLHLLPLPHLLPLTLIIPPPSASQSVCR